MSIFKRNAVIVTVLLFVCVAVYLNWAYNKGDELEDASVGASATPTVSAAVDPAADVTQGALDVEPEGTDVNVPEDDETSADEGSGLFYQGGEMSVDKEHFDAVRLSRQAARDAAVATLATVSETEGASVGMIDSALEEIKTIAENIAVEANLESLILAKGFKECVVQISSGGIQVSVPSPEDGLSAEDVAKITDIVMSETSFSVGDLKIIPVK